MRAGAAIGLGAAAWYAALAPGAWAAGEPEAPIALLPLENLSGSPAPLEEIGGLLRGQLEERAVALLPAGELEAFMERHRVRYVGGLARETNRALVEETAARATLVTALTHYEASPPPKVALISRLVAAGEEPLIEWMEVVQLAGDQRPGLLGTRRVDDLVVLRERALARLADSLARRLGSGRPEVARGGGRGRFKPRTAYRSPAGPGAAGPRLRVAVLPFAHAGPGGPEAGGIVALHVLHRLIRRGDLDLVEPGVLRDVLLEGRVIQEGGLSLAQADLLRALLEVDLLVTGAVMDYLDPVGPEGVPVVAFSMRAIDTATRQVVFSSISHNRGDDGVFFFDLGRVHTAHALASEMAHAVAASLVPRSAPARQGAP
jgi:hypothetical protein